MAEFKHIVRVGNTDLNGNKQILVAMKKIKGIDVMYANAVLSLAGVSKTTKAGNLEDTDIQKIVEVMREPSKFGAPEWILNRRKDYETGKTVHLTSSDLTITNDDDIKRMKKIKSYKGLRHQWGLTVRGQRTKSNFRKNKGKSASVKRKKK
jgi:small subunit ribosomal protein S13